MIQLEIAFLITPDGRYQARVYTPDAPNEDLHVTPIPRADREDADRDARAWIWAHHPDSNFGTFDELN